MLHQPIPYAEAADFIRDKPAVTRDTFNALLPELQGLAFVVSGIEDAGVLQRMRDRIADLPQGASWDEVKRDVLEEMAPYLDSEAGPRRAEILLRHHGFQAYSAAQYDRSQRMKDVMPYFQYLATPDERTRDSHAALDGVVLPVDDPFWDRHRPPWDWGCRCRVVQITREEVEEMQAEDEALPLESRRVLNEHQREMLKSGRLFRSVGGPRGVPQVFDVSAPSERGRSGPLGAQNLRPALEDLRERYDADVWRGFERAMQAARIDRDGPETAWDWLSTGVAPAQSVGDLLRKPNVPVERLRSLIEREPQHPVSETLRLWGVDDKTFAWLIDPANTNPAAQTWRAAMAEALDHIQPTPRVEPIYRAWTPNPHLADTLKKLESGGVASLDQRIASSFSASLESLYRRDLMSEGTPGPFLQPGGILWEVHNTRSGRDYGQLAEALQAYPSEEEVIMPGSAHYRLLGKERRMIDFPAGADEVDVYIIEEA